MKAGISFGIAILGTILDNIKDNILDNIWDNILSHILDNIMDLYRFTNEEEGVQEGHQVACGREAEGSRVADQFEDRAGGRAADRRSAHERQHRQAQSKRLQWILVYDYLIVVFYTVPVA